MTIEKVSRYIRLYSGEDITDPTMYYVDSDNMKFLSRDMYIGLVVRFDNCNMTEIVVGHQQYDNMTVILETIRVDDETLEKLAKEHEIDTFKVIKIGEIRKCPTFYEFSIAGVDLDGTVKFSEPGIPVERDCGGEESA